MRTVIIGLGGIGTYLAEPICRIVSSSQSPRASRRIVLVDGDKYEERNRERQIFRQTAANKAQETAERLKDFFPNLEIEFKPKYISGENVFLFIKEDDVVFLAVDNHATRKIVSDRVATLDNALLISGGNELRDDNTQFMGRGRISYAAYFHASK